MLPAETAKASAVTAPLQNIKKKVHAFRTDSTNSTEAGKLNCSKQTSIELVITHENSNIGGDERKGGSEGGFTWQQPQKTVLFLLHLR